MNEKSKKNVRKFFGVIFGMLAFISVFCGFVLLTIDTLKVSSTHPFYLEDKAIPPQPWKNPLAFIFVGCISALLASAVYPHDSQKDEDYYPILKNDYVGGIKCADGNHKYLIASGGGGKRLLKK